MTKEDVFLKYKKKGDYYDDVGDYEKAILMYNKAIKEKPNDPSPYFNRALVYDKLKKYDETVSSYDLAIKYSKNNPAIRYDAYYNKGMLLKEKGNYDEAIKSFKEATMITKNALDAYYELGGTYDDVKRYDQALEAYENAIRCDPSCYQAHYNKAIVLDRLKRYEESIKAYLKVLEINPEHKSVRERKHDAERHLVENLTKEGLDCCKNFNFDGAVRTFDKLIDKKLASAQVYFHKAKALFDWNETRKKDDVELCKKALETINIFNKLNSDYLQMINAAILKGKILSGLDHIDLAIKSLDDAIARDSRLYEPYYLKAELLKKQKKYDRAKIQYEKAIALNRNDPNLFYSFGNLLLIMENFSDAISNYTEATKLDPNMKIAHFEKGIAFHSRTLYREAISAFDEVIKLDHFFSDAYREKAISLYELKEYNEADKELDNALLYNPKDHRAYYYKALIFMVSKRYDEAILSFEKAISLNPDHYRELPIDIPQKYLAHYFKGNIYKHYEQYDYALKEYEDSIAINKDFGLAHFGKGCILERKRRYEEALEEYDMTIKYLQKTKLDKEYFEVYLCKGRTLIEHVKQYRDPIKNGKCVESEYLAKRYSKNGRIEINEYKQILNDSIKLFDMTLNLNSHHSQAHYYKAKAFECLGEYKEALHSYKEAIHIDDTLFYAFYDLGLVYFKIGRYDRAKNSFDKATYLKPNDIKSHFYKALSLEFNQRYEDAEKCYEKLLENEDNARYYNYSLVNLTRIMNIEKNICKRPIHNYDVFISYSREQWVAVANLQNILIQENLTFYKQENRNSDDFYNVYPEKIIQSRIVVVLLSESYLACNNCYREFNIATRHNNYLLAIICTDSSVENEFTKWPSEHKIVSELAESNLINGVYKYLINPRSRFEGTPITNFLARIKHYLNKFITENCEISLKH